MKGFHSTTDESYSKKSLLYLMNNFLSNIFIFSLGTHYVNQIQAISKNSRRALGLAPAKAFSEALHEGSLS